MQIRIDGTDLPGNSCGPSPDSPGGYRNIHVGLQRRGRPSELRGVVSATEPAASWTIDCELVSSAAGPDLRGPYIQGPPRGRFIYLNWGTVDAAGTFTMFRRAKLMLDAVPADVIGESARSGLLVGTLGLTDAKGHPSCAAMRPPAIEWTAG